MPGKYESIVALAAAAAQKITRGGEAYMAFLTTAAHNFKYNFRDQLLIYAQKPEATACAEIDFWNRHGRYVNKGTHGIALLVDTDAPYKLRHVFDMSDTNSRAGRVVPVWQMQPQYEAAVIEALENHFGEVTDRADFHACLLDTAKNIVEDNFSDYYADLLTVKEGSLLEELDEDSTEVWFRGLLQNSVAFMLLTRCGEDPTAYFEALDFSRIYDFNTPETISILGAAASDISEMALREVAVTVRSLMREEYLQNRTFAENSKRPYDRARETNSERSAAHGSDLQSRGRLSAAQPDRTGGPEGREIWDAASQLPQEPPQRHLHRDDALRESGRASGGDRPAGPRDGGAPDRTDGGAAGRERAVESNRSDEVGGSDEQHQSLGGGNRPAGADLQLTPTAPDIDWQAVGPAGLTLSHRAELPSSDIAYYHEDGEKNELIRTSDALKNHRTEIAAFFAAHENGQERGDFLKAFFDNILVEKILSNGQRAGYRAYDDGLLLWRGAFLTREQEVFLPWPQAADTIHGMMLLDHWLAPDERPLPTVNEQLSLIEQAESEKGSAFVLPQAAIDHVLCGGPAYSARRLRIYAQYQKQQGAQANARFLKDEYGIGSHSNAIPGSSMWVKYDGKGMTFTLGDLTAPEATVTLTWKQVEKRVGELIAADRYLTPADKEQYQVKLAQDALQAARGEIAEEFRSIVIAYKDYAEQHGQPDKTVDRWYLVNCADAFHYGMPKMYARTAAGDDILPMMREAMRTIIGENTPLTGRCEAVLAALDGELAKPLEPEIAPPMEYRLSLGDTVYLGAQAFEIISLDGKTVRLYDPTFPLLNQELPRVVFDQRLAENPRNDHLLQSVEHTDEAPAAPVPAQQPVGRIDFLGTDGNVGDSVEYDDAEQFVAAIKEENHDGVPVRIVLYRDSGGRTISQDFLSELDPPPQGFQVMDAAEAQLDEARRRINAYCNEVFGQEADFSDLSHVDLAYSSTGDGAHSVGIFADLIHFRMVYQVDGATVVDIPCDTLRELNEYLANLDFDEMVAYAEEQYWQGEHAEPERTEQGQPEDSPFVRQVMQDVERVAAEDTTEPYERFHVIELDRGSKIAYGIWDDLHDGIYVDEDGVQEEFDGEWAANAYLERLKKAEAEKTAEDWLAVERAKLPPLEYAAGDHFSIFAADGNSKREVVLTSITDEDVFYLSTTQPEQEPVWMDKGEFERSLRSGHIREVQPSPAERETLQPVARYRSDGETILVYQYPNARYYIHYCYNDQQNTAYATAGGFDTFAQAEAALFSHRPAAERATESAKEPQADAQGVEQPEQKAPLPPPPSRPRVRTSPFVMHPEIPEGQRHEYHITDDAIGVGTPGERFNHNVRAIRLLKRLETEDRLATPEEQEILAQYVGWGGLADCFDERHSKYAELKALLDEDEYAAARESTLTAFYTPPVVIRAIYQALENMGFQRGNVLEPSCGIGSFIGMRPDSMSGVKIYGVELDSISGRIARQLYQKSSIAVQGFEKTDLPDSFFDTAIGNVPFGAFTVPDKRYDKHNFLIHDYFFARTLDKVRPGGVIAFITSKGTMDKENPAVRKYIAQRADLLGAIRLPNNTFKDAAGTDATSDILFLQKRDTLSYEEPAWVHLNTDENGLKMNQYFIDHPEMVIGEVREISGPYGPETACLPREGQDLSQQLAAAIGNIQGAFTEYVLDDPEADEDLSIPADPNVRNFSFAVVDGEVYYRENSVMNPVEVSVTAANRIKGLIEIRDCVRTLIEYQTEDFPEEDIAAEQRKLNALYDAFVKKYGRINDRGNKIAFDTDSAYFLLASLEVLDDEGGFVRKADMFSKRTIKQRTVVTSVDTASEALALSLAERACVDLSYMASLMGGSEKIPQIVEDLAGVIFKDPQSGPFDFAEGGAAWVNGWQTADEYLSGNVREKLAQARQAAAANPRDFTSNVEALEAVQPKDLSASEISVRLGATWLPPELVEQFMFELFDTPNYCKWNIHVRFSQYTGEWNIEGKSYDRGNVKATKTYGTADVTGYKIIEETLNLRDVRIFDYHDDEKGRRVPVLDKKATAIAQGKQEQIKQAFQDWIWKDPQRRERLCRLYNDKFNAVRPREYDGSHLNFVGINPEITLRPHQVNAVAHILYGGNTLLAHVVGAGKTFEMVAAAQESKRLGLCQKSLFVVPNHLTEQWAAEYLQLYPSANILVATKKDFETRNRKRFCGRIATGDYDAIIIGHSQFEKIPMSVERQRFMLERQMREILDGLAELKANHGERFSVKQLERARKGVQAKLDKLNDQSRKDDVVTFEELGVDRLFVDEAHYYKNLAAFSKMRNVGGISQTEAQKSSDLYMKCRYLDELTDGHGVVFATGTPISNTMVEMYTMQKYLQYHTLKKNGLLHFDAWASTFGETVTAMELAPEGTGYRSKTRFAKFYNLPELMAMFKEVADIQTADMLNLPIPKAVYRHIVLKPSEHQKEMVADLSQRAERVRNHMVESSEDNMLLITNDGRKLALDQRMLSPMLPDSATSKVRACAENVFSIWRQTAEKRSTQLVFCDLSTPKSDGTFSVYNDLREKLIAMGIPEDEIAFIHSANTETKKKELFGKVCSGQIRVLLGSTQKMGAGTNVQQKLIALHHLDCPWRPADLQQREGRIVRQGNENDEVDIYTYVTENTFDSYLYQLVESKQKFIGQIMTSKSPVRSAEDIDETALSYAEIKALCTGNPHIKEKMDLDVAVQRLNLLKSNHLSQKYELEDQINKYFPREIAEYEQTIAGYQADMAYLAANTHPDADGFSPMEIEGTVYTEKKAAGSAILAACKAMTSPDPVPLGQYRGFAMSLSFNSLSREFHISLKNRLHYDVALGMDLFGNIQRIDNALDGMGNHLRDCEVRLENVKVQLANAKVEVEKPFPQEEELREKTARLNELNVMLSMDKPENEIVDDGRGVDTAEPVRSSGDRAR